MVIRAPEARRSSTTCSTRTDPGTSWLAAVDATNPGYPLMLTAICCVQLALW